MEQARAGISCDLAHAVASQCNVIWEDMEEEEEEESEIINTEQEEASQPTSDERCLYGRSS